MILIDVEKDRIVLTNTETLVARSKRIYHARVRFSEEWSTLIPRLVFRNGQEQIGIMVDPTIETEIEIPWEVTQSVGSLRVGAVGSAIDGTIRIVPEKTVGYLLKGTEDEDVEQTHAPTPDLISQIQDAALLRIGNGLKLDDGGRICVDTASAVQQDNTKPVTSAAVYVELGNVEALLSII